MLNEGKTSLEGTVGGTNLVRRERDKSGTEGRRDKYGGAGRRDKPGGREETGLVEKEGQHGGIKIWESWLREKKRVFKKKLTLPQDRNEQRVKCVE